MKSPALFRPRCCGLSDAGRRREKNEDYFLAPEAAAQERFAACPPTLFAVADGIGGHAAGEVASQMACEGLAAFYEQLSKDPSLRLSPGALRRSLARAFFAIDERIGCLAASREKYAHMGTTLSAMVLCRDRAVIAHVGDSRIYRLAGGRFEQLTVDHTFVQDLISYGELAPEQAAAHPLRHMLTGAIGTEEPLESVFADTVSLRPGDRILLCTDGLYDMMDNGEIARILDRAEGASEAAFGLVGEANDRGGRDNVTVVVVFL